MCDILNANAKGYTYNVKEIKWQYSLFY
jgi:hypothetical protein